MKTVPSVLSFLMNTIYLSISTQVTEGTVLRKHTVHVSSSQNHSTLVGGGQALKRPVLTPRSHRPTNHSAPSLVH